MTNARAIEMFIKPNFKYFLLPFGLSCVHSAYTFNSENLYKAFHQLSFLNPHHVITETIRNSEIAKETIKIINSSKNNGYNVISSVHAENIEDILRRLEKLLSDCKVEDFLIDMSVYIDRKTRKVSIKENLSKE